MVDMVEARKRAKKNIKSSAAPALPETQEMPVGSPSQGKPVLRSESPTVSQQPSYFPVVQPEKRAWEQREQPEIAPSPIPLESFPEDQVEFLKKILQEDYDDEDAERLAEGLRQEELEVLIFQLGSEHYGMSIHQIAEIIRFVEPTSIPNTIGFVDGIISLRGRMIPVINGRSRLGHPAKEPDKKTRIIVLNEGVESQGILVDSASHVVRLPKKDIEPTPSVVVGVDAEFIQGVCEYKNQLIILLNLERFLEFR